MHGQVREIRIYVKVLSSRLSFESVEIKGKKREENLCEVSLKEASRGRDVRETLANPPLGLARHIQLLDKEGMSTNNRDVSMPLHCTIPIRLGPNFHVSISTPTVLQGHLSHKVEASRREGLSRRGTPLK